MSRLLNYTHITTNTTTNLSNRPCFLDSIVINTVGATGNTITVYDGYNGAGNIIAVIDGTVEKGKNYECQCLSGLSIVTANGTCADITVLSDTPGIATP